MRVLVAFLCSYANVGNASVMLGGNASRRGRYSVSRVARGRGGAGRGGVSGRLLM